MVLHITQMALPGPGRLGDKALVNLTVKDFQVAIPSSHSGDLGRAAPGLRENMEPVR